MSDYTPTTEDVRTYYGLGCYEFQPDSCEHPSERHAEFDAWYAAEIAAAKAEALREAAEAWQADPEGVRPGPWKFMRRRADQIEAQS